MVAIHRSGFKRRATVAAGVMAMLVVGWGTGCASTEESAGGDTLTSHVGRYDLPPTGLARPRVGVPAFSVTTGQGVSGQMDQLAADQMTTLLNATERFRVIERAQLQKLLDEQNLTGVVRPGEIAGAAQIHGVDYLLLGKVTNLRVKREEKSTGFGLAQIGGLVELGGLDVKNKSVVLTTEAGVDIRLVDPTTGEVVISNFSEYKRTDTAKAMGLDILGASATADASIEIDEDNQGKILRLALDDSLRKSLPKIDRFLASLPAASAAAPAVPVGVTTPASSPANATPQAAKFCSHCGKGLTADAKFCASCGAKSE